MSKILLHNGTIVTSEKECAGSILIEEDLISEVIFSDEEDYPRHMAKLMTENPDMDIMELDGLHVMAAGIDAHVHFREPGLTHKADFETESRAAAAGHNLRTSDKGKNQTGRRKDGCEHRIPFRSHKL